MLKMKSKKLIAILLSVLMSGLIPAAVTLADNLIVDGDNLTPISNNTLDFGEVSPNEIKSKNALLAISRQGNGQIFLSDASVAVSLLSNDNSALGVTMNDTVIELPVDWSTASNNSTTPDTASSTVTLTVPSGAAEGTYTSTLIYQATGMELDNKGNRVSLNRTGSLTVTYTVKFPQIPEDNTAPTATHTLTPDSWTNGTVVIVVTAQDLGSGLESITGPAGTTYEGSTATFTATMNGYFTFILKDNAGNSDDYVVLVDKIDRVAPTADHSLSPSTWTNGDVEITVTGDDDASGVKSIKDPSGTVTDGKTTTFTTSTNGRFIFTIEDNAGNTFDYTVVVDNIDKVDPTATHLLDPESWTNGNVKITVTGDDDASGVKSISLLDEDKLETPLALLDGATAESKKAEYTVNDNGTYVFLITDNAGNSFEYSVVVGTIDRNAPTITIDGKVYTGGETINLGYIALDFDKSISYTATDDLSGFAPSGNLSKTGQEIIDTTAEGMSLSQIFTVTDQAGNSTSITFTYHVISMETLVRLLRPVEMDPALNIFKKGSTVPIKLQLLDEHGMPSQMSASDLNFVLRHVSGAGTIGTKVNPSPIASFRLSNDGYTYIYNLSTKNLSVGSHVLAIDLSSGNGSIGTIGFKLR